MEPQLPSPHVGEQAPSRTERITPNFTGFESAPTRSDPERQAAGQTYESQPSGPGDPYAQAAPVAPPPLPQLVAPVITPPVAAADDDNPVVAADDDLIEKSWVEKAKKVVSETRHDPYLQEQAVSRLQADYLQKRYNKNVKMPDSGA